MAGTEIAVACGIMPPRILLVALAVLVAAIPGGASAQSLSAAFAPARRMTGPAPASPSPSTVGWVEEAMELAVDTHGRADVAQTLDSTVAMSLVYPAVSEWMFRPAAVRGIPVESRVLLVAVFRPAEMMTAVSPATSLAVADSALPAVTGTSMPAYPPLAAGDAVVVTELRVDDHGRVVQAVAVNSVPGFDGAALAAARQWSFRPAQRHGKAVPAFVYLVFGFRRPIR
jgi:TonB family protein